MKNILKSNAGITLIALVVTILILLILSTVSLNLIAGGDGIISKASKAVDETKNAQIKEQLNLCKIEAFATNKTFAQCLAEKNLVDLTEIENKGISQIINNENTLVLNSYNGLKILSENAKNGEDYSGKTVYLIDDINCGSSFDSVTEELLSGENFEPIVNFNGIFDGNGYTINNLYIKNIEETAKGVALISKLSENGVVRNLTIDSSYINGYSNTGAIVGINYGQIINCVNKSNIKGYKLTGGIVGRSFNIVENCENYGNILTSEEQTGGIVGNCDYGNPVVVRNCKNYGNIESNSYIVGGIVGGAWRGDEKNPNIKVNVIISNCENYGNIEAIGTQGNIGGIAGVLRGTIINCKNDGSVAGYSNVGGIAGSTSYYNSTNTLIENCKNAGNITGKNKSIGGICGANSGGTVSKCANIGNVSLLGEDAFFGVAGIVGAGGSSTNNTYIEKCYNEGIITLELAASNSAQVAGIVGNLGMTANTGYIGYVENCYNSGEIICLNSNSNNSPVGIVHWSRNCVIKNCYNIGKLSSENQRISKGIGFSYDLNFSIFFENNYWLDTCGADYGIATGNSNEGAEPKNSEELKALAETLGDAYAQDDNINDGYPYLIDNMP